MDAETSNAVSIPEDRYIHLKDIKINFVGRLPTSAIILHLHVDDTSFDHTPGVKARTVKWNCGLYVSQRSRITLNVLRIKNGVRNFLARGVVAIIELEVGKLGIKQNLEYSCLDPERVIQANFTFADFIDRKKFIGLLGNDVRNALASKVVFLDRIKNVSAFLKLVLAVGKDVSELNNAAKVAFRLANRLFKVLQEQQEFHHKAMELAELLDMKLYLFDIIPEKLQQTSVRKSLKDLLDIIEEILTFIRLHVDRKSLNQLEARLRTLADLKGKLFAASELLSLCLVANVFVMTSDMHQDMHDTVLEKKLKPVLSALSSVDHRCLEGTREIQLAHIINWAQTKSSISKIYHVHGVAGSGKSSMASTICEMLKSQKMLAGTFFCKRDYPDQRDPKRILPSLSFTLALRHEAYRKCIVQSLEDELDITNVSIEQQLKVLFREPLAELSQDENRIKPFIFVVDALDECGDDVSRPRLTSVLCQLASLTDWLKVFVTSRPLNDIMRSISLTDSGKVTSVDLNALDSENDIRLYTRASLKDLVQLYGLEESWLDEDTIEKLTTLASGLFIWTSTMFRFVREQFDKDEAMELVLSGNVTGLDGLYTTVIEGGSSDDKNQALKKAVLGVISVTARNMPLSVDGLYDFLQGTGKRVSKGTLMAVINHLRSVLYEDVSKGNVIRVCHPSFLDFLEDHERSGVYWTNIEELHASMAETSLNLMMTKLRFNICNLESSYIANKDVENPSLVQRIKDKIPESLIYGCLYWAAHLIYLKANSVTIGALVIKFFQSLKTIYWVEILSLIDKVKMGLDALQDVIRFFKGDDTLCSLATDLRRLILSSYDAIIHSTAHLYVSALAWLPAESPLHNLLSCTITTDALIVTGRNKEWPPMLWMYTLGDSVQHVVFSLDNSMIAACSKDGNIAIFDAKTGVVEMRLQSHCNAVWSVAFSPDRKYLASGSADSSVIIWDLRTGDMVGMPLTGHSDTVNSVAYSPDGCFIASRSRGEIRTWDAHLGAAVHVMEGCREFGRLAYSHDGAKIACCGVEGIIIRDANSGKLLNKLSGIDHITDVTFSRDGRFLASGGMDHCVRVWDAESFVVVAELEGHSGYVYSVIFPLNDDRLFSASMEGKLILWDLSSCQKRGMAAQESTIWSAACSSDGRLYTTASRDGSLRVWNAESYFHTESLPVNGHLWRVACSPGGREIASASNSGDIYIHSLDCGSLLRTLRGHTDEVITIVYSPDGKFLASGSIDCTVRVWDERDGLELYTFKGHEEWVSSVVFLPDGKQLFSSSADGTVRGWNIDGGTGTDGTILRRVAGEITCMSLSQNGKLLALGGDDGCIYFGGVSGGEMKELRIEPTYIRTLAFSPGETYLASGSEDEIIRLWDLDTQAEVKRFGGHTSAVFSIDFSRDGQRVLSSTADNSIRQWRVDTGEELCQLKGHTNTTWHAVFSVDGKSIISCSVDGTIRVWDADPEEKWYVGEIDERLSSLEFKDGWIKSKAGELLLWVPSEYRNGFKDMCKRCIPADAPNRPVRLDWSKLVRGENWTDVHLHALDPRAETRRETAVS